MRQHVNPLSSFFQSPLALPDSSELFENDQLPIHLDIGCARGKFLLDLAKINSQWNFLGIEIRESLVVAAEKERVKEGLGNLKFLFCNANISLKDWLSNLRSDQLQRVSIQFPDPWFKRRHFKRRVLQPELLLLIAGALSHGGELFIQSDIKDIFESMVRIIEGNTYFKKKELNGSFVIDSNPYRVLTEREVYAISKKLIVHRAFYYRNNYSVK